MDVVLLPGSIKPWDGIEVYSFELAKNLSKNGVNVVGVKFSHKNDIVEYDNNFKLILVKTPNINGSLGYNLRLFYSTLKEYKILQDSDIVHAIGGYYASVELLPLHNKVVTIIGASALRENSLLKKTFRRIYSSLIYRFASAYIVPNRVIEKEVKHYGIKPVVIPIGINLDSLKSDKDKNEIRRNYGFNDNDILILYLGQLVNGKRLPELFKSFKLVNEKNPKTKLVLVAWGYLKDELIKLSRELGISEKVFFINPVEYEKRKYIYAMSDIFVMLGDSFGDGGISSAVLDALGSGLPIIVSKNTANSEVVKDGYNGFSVDPTNYSEVADYILLAIENRDKLSRGSLEISKNLDWNVISKKIIELYKSLI